MLRYSLAGLFLVVLLAALACAALLYASPRVANIAVTVTVACLFAALLVACFGRGRRRAAAGGLALVGWGYLLLSSSSFLTLQANLLTTDALHWLYKTMHEQDAAADPAVVGATRFLQGSNWQPDRSLLPPGPSGNGMDGMGDAGGDALGAFSAGGYVRGFTFTPSPPAAPRVDQGAFRTIGQAIWSLLLGLIGALAAGLIYARGRRAEAARPPD